MPERRVPLTSGQVQMVKSRLDLVAAVNAELTLLLTMAAAGQTPAVDGTFLRLEDGLAVFETP